MKIRGITLAVLVISAIALFLDAPAAIAQASSGLDVADGADGSSSGSSRTDNAGDGADPSAPEEYDPDAPPPGAEIHVIIAGESEAAAAYAAGDSVTGFDAADMEALGALNVSDLSGFTPNLEIVTAGATTPTFFIRGIGLNDFNSNASGSVAIFQDDVAMNSPALQLGTIFDMENVIIARGPVGTGAARNASAGAIRLYSRKPRGTYNGYLRTQLGNYGFNDFEGAIEAPVYEDILLARFAFRSSQRNGYQTNACGGMPPAFDPITGQPLRAQFTGNGSTRRAPFSLCGENVTGSGGTSGASGFSPIEAGLPTELNDLGNWATRLTLRYQPTLDQDWLINGHVGNRDQFSSQGISYGVAGQQVFPDGSQVSSILSGSDGSQGNGGFRRPEVTSMIDQYEALLTTATGGVINPQRIVREYASIGVANQIADSLDINPYNGYYNAPGDTRNLTYGGYVRGEIAMPNDLLFTTLSAYDAYDRFIQSDTDQSPNTLFEITTKDEGWQFYQNLELTGALHDYPIDWTVGAYYLQESLDVLIFNDFGANQLAGGVTDRDYTQDTWSLGTYFGFGWAFWDDFKLDGGARYNWDKKAIDYSLVSGNRPPRTTMASEARSAPTGEIRLTYNFRDDTHAYWKYSRGWKGGHYNATSSLRQGVTYAEPEENNAYETGLRGSWFDNKIGMELSFFLYDYSNYQLFTVQNDFSSNPEFVVINASDVQVYGSEAQVTARPWDNTNLQARFGWLESTFIDFVQRQVVRETTPSGVLTRELELNFTGNRLLNSPQFTINLTAEHTVQLGRYGAMTARWDGAWTDTTFFDATEGRGVPNNDGVTFMPANTIGRKPFWLHNLLIIYRPPVGNVVVEAWVRNLTDEVYKSFAFDASQFQRTSIYFTGAPRMFGGTISVTF